MITYIGRRFLWIIPVLFTVSVITFFLMHAVPGGPWDREKHLPQGTQDRLNAQYGLDQPLYVQYISWAGAFIQGDFGPSYRFQDRRVNDIVADGIWTTVQLGVMAFILSVAVGIPLGIFAALGHNRGPDYLATSISIIGIATPVFVIAILLIVFFSVQLGWFPTGGWKGPQYWVLPTIALAGFPIAIIARYTRASMLEVTRKDYIRTAQSKGLQGPGGRDPPHDPQRPHPGRDDPRSDARLPGDRFVHHRADLRHPGHRPVLHHVDLDP